MTDYNKLEIEETETYKKLSGATETSRSAVSTIVLIVAALVLAVVFVFRLAGIFEINKQTRKLQKATSNTSAHLTLEENKTVGQLSERDAAEIAAANQMKKPEDEDIVSVDSEGCEFTRVYYNEKQTEEVEETSVTEKISRFLGLIKFKDDEK